MIIIVGFIEKFSKSTLKSASESSKIKQRLNEIKKYRAE